MAAPVLDWDDETADNSPDFLIDFDENDVVEGNNVTIEIYSNAGLTLLVDTVTHALTAAEILSGTISMGGSALADGTYYVRTRVESGAWSNTEIITISGGGGPPAVSGSSSSGSGSGGGWTGGRRRSINFEEMYRHIDAVTKLNEREKRASYERIGKTIAEAVNALSEGAEKTGSPQPRAVIKQAHAVQKRIDKEIVAALAGKPVPAPWFGLVRDLQSDINALTKEMQAAQERIIARARELEEDDEDILLLMDD